MLQKWGDINLGNRRYSLENGESRGRQINLEAILISLCYLFINTHIFINSTYRFINTYLFV